MKKLTLNCLIVLSLLANCLSAQKNRTIEISSSNTITTNSSLWHKEPYRPQFHFSPEKKWMNDPNGMLYYKGTYHLFYQYYPGDIVWGPMHWGMPQARI